MAEYWSQNDTDENPWNNVFLGTFKLPGTLADYSITHANDVDTGEAQGTSGATSVTKGKKPKRVSLTMQMHTQEQYAQFPAMLAELNIPGQDGTVRDFEITHPDIDDHKLRTVKYVSYSTGKPNAGIKTYTLQFDEVLPPQKTKKKATPTAPKKTFGETGFPPPQNDLA
jgi:hypothetical protein